MDCNATSLVKNHLASNPKELVSQIAGFFDNNMLITEYDLKCPQTNKLKEFYANFLFEFFIDENSHRLMTMAQGQIVNNSCEMYSQLIPLINLVQTIKHFKIPGLNNISINDLLNPQPKSTFKHLANAMSFLSFADNRALMLEPKLNKLKKNKDLKKQLLNSLDEIKQDYNKFIGDIKNKEKSENEVKSQIEHFEFEFQTMKNEIEELNKTKDIVTNENNKLQAEMQDLNNLYKSLLEDNSELKNQENRIKENVSTTQSKPQMGLDMLVLKKNDILEKVDNYKKRIAEQEEMSLKLKQLIANQMNRDKILTEIRSLITSHLEMVQNQGDTIDQDIVTKVETIKSLKMALEEVQTKLNKSKDYYEERVKQSDNEYSNVKIKLFEVEEQAKKKEINYKEREQLKNNIANNENVYNLLLDQIIEKNEEKEKEIDAMFQSFFEAMEAVKSGKRSKNRNG